MNCPISGFDFICFFISSAMAAFSEWRLDLIAHHKAIAETPFSEIA
ncbi:Hypothetical protein P9303_10591 [Prochlorococcus marinus str. MIT 9303]|uniref:Uncharacterized protein n=1 Tax=Prochlorococcus marinus (strain MIT 9303) TaxID=59922 RepID=A2C8J8_PROM3|nr:Hypothetical protein P9303_10591 [Prochlorococcus marinus str. MIT 9303]